MRPSFTTLTFLLDHGLRTPGEEIAFNARPKIHSHSQIFRYLWFMPSLGVRSPWSRRKVNVVKLGRKSYRWILQLKLKYFEKATKIWQNIHLSFDMITYFVKSELRIQNLSNIVWPSQNTWTLLTYISTYVIVTMR